MKTTGKRIKGKYVLFCDYALISQDGKISFIGEFDRLFSTSDTAFLNRAFLVAKIIGEPGLPLTLEVSLVKDRTKEVMFKTDLAVKLDERGTAGLLIELSQVSFRQFGLYKALITEGGRVVAEADLEVVKVEAPKMAQA